MQQETNPESHTYTKRFNWPCSLWEKKEYEPIKRHIYIYYFFICGKFPFFCNVQSSNCHKSLQILMRIDCNTGIFFMVIVIVCECICKQIFSRHLFEYFVYFLNKQKVFWLAFWRRANSRQDLDVILYEYNESVIRLILNIITVFKIYIFTLFDS